MFALGIVAVGAMAVVNTARRTTTARKAMVVNIGLLSTAAVLVAVSVVVFWKHGLRKK